MKLKPIKLKFFYFIIIIGCFIVIASYIVSYLANYRIKFDDLRFDTNQATRIVIQSHRKLLPPLVIDEAEKVEFAKKFIQRYSVSSGWECPRRFSSTKPKFTFSINFYEEDHLLGWIGVEPPDSIVYFPCKKSLMQEDLETLNDTLGIPTEYVSNDD